MKEKRKEKFEKKSKKEETKSKKKNWRIKSTKIHKQNLKKLKQNLQILRKEYWKKNLKQNLNLKYKGKTMPIRKHLVLHIGDVLIELHCFP